MCDFNYVKNPTKNKPIVFCNDFKIFKKESKFFFELHGTVFNIQPNQKVLRKFSDTILEPLMSFFKEHPEYCKKFFIVYYNYLKEDISVTHSEEFIKKVIAVLFEGFNLLDNFLINSKQYTQLVSVDVNKKSKNSKNNLIEKDVLINFIYYSWKLKLFSFFKYLTTKEVPIKMDKYVMNYLVNNHLNKYNLDTILLNIIKGKVISTLSTRKDIWTYLTYSVRKSPELYIAQLFNYTVQYILLFMKDSYNPIGYISNFIDRQIVYVFSDVYYNEMIYHDIDDFHLTYTNLLDTTLINEITKYINRNVIYFYDADVVNNFFSQYYTNLSVTNMILGPIINNIIFNLRDSLIYKRTNLKLYTLYIAILLKSSYIDLPFLSEFILSIPVSMKKINSRKKIRHTILINSLYDHTNFRNIEILKDNQVFNSIINNFSILYKNVVTGKLYDFDINEFIKEYAILFDYLNSDTFCLNLNKTLVDNEFRFKKMSIVDKLNKKKVKDNCLLDLKK